MYQITTVAGRFVGYADVLHYIRKSDSGVYTPTTQPKAQGIAYNSVAYNLMGHDEIDGETVIIGDADFGGFVARTERLSDAVGVDTTPEDDNKWIAARSYEPGDYLTVDGVLYKVILPIVSGSRITVGTNVEQTAILSEIANFNKEVAV